MPTIIFANATADLLSRTRWVCTYTSVKAVMSQIAAVVETLIVLVDDRDPKTSQESYSLLIALCDFEFIFGLVTLHMILANTASLSAYLQGKDVDVVHAREAALGTKETFKKMQGRQQFSTRVGKSQYSVDRSRRSVAGQGHRR